MITLTPGLVAFLGGAAVIVLAVGLWIPTYARSRDLRRRLGLLASVPAGVAVDLGGRRWTRGVPRARADNRNPLVRSIERWIERSGLDLTATEVAGAMVLLGAAGGVVGSVALGLVGALVVGAVGFCSPPAWIAHRLRARQVAFLKQLPDTVALLASTVRAGHSLVQGLEQVAREAPEPTRTTIEQTVREIGLGAPQDEAMERIGERYWSEDLDLILTAISVQQQVGGSLAVILDEMAETLRERDRIRRDISALTGPQRYSAYVLALLPVAVTGVLMLVSRDYMTVLFTGLMRIALAVAVLMVVVGFLVMRRMADIDV